MNNSPLTIAIVAIIAIAAGIYVLRSFQPSHDSARGSLIVLGVLLGILYLGWTMFVR